MPRLVLPAGVLSLLLNAPIAWGQFDPCLFYDLNKDTLLNQADADLFFPCMTGPGLLQVPFECEGLDADGDGDIDQDDYGRFQACIGHSAIPVWPVISEFMASNRTGLKDQFGNNPDWIEVHNPSQLPLRLKDWFLTDNPNRPDKWRFPDVTVPPGGFLTVFASDSDLTDPAKPLHTNFKLEAEGEYLALVTPDLTVVHAYTPQFLAQFEDVSYGLAMSSTDTVLVAPGADCRVLIPNSTTGPAIGTTWTGGQAFSDATWTAGRTGVGYEATSGYEGLFLTNVIAMRNVNRSCFIRIPFLVDDPGKFQRLVLRMKYDDGFAAYLNGQLVAWALADVDNLAWNSGATGDHPDSQAVVYQDFDITDDIGWLRQGSNVLAIHGLNATLNSSDFLIIPELVAGSVQLVQPLAERYFVSSTPGAVNVGGTAVLGPVIREHQYTPTQPNDLDAILVTAKVIPTTHPISVVRLNYRLHYNPTVNAVMFDDGSHGDGAAGDGVYGLLIPASFSGPGQMVRWYITATDTANNTSRWPLFDNPLNSPEYFGTMIADASFTSQLPVLYWFIQNPAAADTESGTRCSLFYNGEFYDNVEVHIRGNTSSGWPKHNFKFDFNSGYHFRFLPDQTRTEEMNLNSTYSDKAYIRQVLSAEAYLKAGSPTSIAFPLRVQQNGAFYSVAVFVEEPDEDYLQRHDLDPHGALYKMFNQLDSATSGVDKRTRRSENNSDLQALINGINLSGDARKRYLFDNVNIPACINYIAATTVMHDNDHVQKNYYLYRDTEDTGEWRFLPWDKDLTWGRNFGAGGGVLSDGIWAANDDVGRTNVSPSHPLFGDSTHQKYDFLWNRLIDALHNTPEIREMYLRRLRTVMDEQLQPPGTPAANLLIEKRIDELVAQMLPETTLDFNKWPQYGQTQTFAQAISILKTQYLAVRRTHLYNTHSTPNNGIIPGPQPANPPIQFGAIEHSPPSGIQDEEYIEIRNPNNYAVDISGWKLLVDGKKKHTFHPGTVLRANGSLYATPKARVFRARTVSPKGNEMRLVQGNYDNHIAPGETISLVRPDDSVAASFTIP
ncbi:MAG: CotH kinase family protein [Phycisphaerae bacterium]|jgi:hypothetical protein